MFRGFLKLSLIVASMLSGAGACLALPPLTAAQQLQMEREADDFLDRLPDGLQDRQTTAVERALAGDFGALMAVRNSRNARPEIPAGVDTLSLMLPARGGYGIPARLYTPRAADAKQLPVVVYCHGGGWTFGSLNSCAAICGAIAATGRAKVLAIDYRLAPEHPYPAALNDVEDAITYASTSLVGSSGGTDTVPVVVAGDSSGANLALCSVVRLIADAEKSGRPQAAVKGVVAIYPVVKAATAADDASWHKYNRTYGLDAPLMEAFNRAYTGGNDSIAGLQDVSPAYAPARILGRFPPTLVVNAGRDILADQGAAFCARLSEAGAATRHETLPGAVHLFATVAGQPEAFARTVALIEEHIRALR